MTMTLAEIFAISWEAMSAQEAAFVRCAIAADAFNAFPAERPNYNLRASIERPTPASAPYDCEVV